MDDTSQMLVRFKRLMHDLENGSPARNSFRPWEVGLLLDPGVPPAGPAAPAGAAPVQAGSREKHRAGIAAAENVRLPGAAAETPVRPGPSVRRGAAEC